MADPFLSQITMFGGNFAPKNYAFCNGGILPINQNQALFSLLGTTYGGDGRQTFGLPNLQGRTPIGVGNGHTLGESSGETSHTLNSSEMPMHLHFANAISTTASTNLPTGNLVANSTPNTVYGPVQSLSPLNPTTIGNVGGNQPHENEQPYLVLSFCIALQGIFPSQN